MSFIAGPLGKTLCELHIDEDMLADDDESKEVMSTTILERVRRNRQTHLELYGRQQGRLRLNPELNAGAMMD